MYSLIWDKNYIIIYANDLDIYKIDINSEEFISFHNPLCLQIYNSKRFIFSPDLSIPPEIIIDYINIYKFDINPKTFNDNKNDENTTIIEEENIIINNTNNNNKENNTKNYMNRTNYIEEENNNKSNMNNTNYIEEESSIINNIYNTNYNGEAKSIINYINNKYLLLNILLIFF